MGQRVARARHPRCSRARDGLSAEPGRRTARLRRRRLRGHHGPPVRRVGLLRGGGVSLRERRGGARSRRARAAGRGAGEPPRDGPGDPRPRPGLRRAVRGEDPRQRAGVHRQALPALPPVRGRGARGCARRARRLPPHRRVALGRDGRPGRFRRGHGSARRAWTSSASPHASPKRPARASRPSATGWRPRWRPRLPRPRRRLRLPRRPRPPIPCPRTRSSPTISRRPCPRSPATSARPSPRWTRSRPAIG